MDVQVAALCDAAGDYGGKLSILGAFDTIAAQQLPVVHPHCSLALRMVFRKEEEGWHALMIKFGDEDGRPLLQPIETTFEVCLPGELFLISRNLVLNLQHMTFTKPGTFSVEVYVDGAVVASIPLVVRVGAPDIS